MPSTFFGLSTIATGAGQQYFTSTKAADGTLGYHLPLGRKVPGVTDNSYVIFR